MNNFLDILETYLNRKEKQIGTILILPSSIKLDDVKLAQLK